MTYQQVNPNRFIPQSFGEGFLNFYALDRGNQNVEQLGREKLESEKKN